MKNQSETAKKKDVVFILTGNKTPPSFTLASADAPRSRLFAKGTYDPIRYSIYHESPLVKNQKEGEIHRDQIVFEEGVLVVSHSNTVLLNFLRVHPQLDVTFKELNHEKMAKEELAELNLEYDAMHFAKTADIEVLASALRILTDANIDDYSVSEIRRDAMYLAKNDPESLLSISQDPSFDIKNVCIRSVSEGHLGLRHNDSAIYYNFPEKKSKLLTVPTDETWQIALERYLISEEGKDLYVALKKLLDIK